MTRMSTDAQTLRRRSLLVLDFDGTITTKDTIALLAQVGYKRQHTLSPWSFFVDSYSNDYAALQDAKRKPTTLDDFLDRLEATRPVEMASIQRVQEHGVFAELNSDTPRSLGYTCGLDPTLLRPGLDKLLLHYPIYIISVNWSREFMAGVLEAQRLVTNDSNQGIAMSRIYANTLELNSDKTTGRILGNIHSGRDKRRVLEEIMRETGCDASEVIYVGDSLTDLECLLHAGTGVVMEPKQKMRDILQQYGITIRDGSDPRSAQCTGKTLFAAYNWEDVANLLDPGKTKSIA